jgi:hypothetical protein
MCDLKGRSGLMHFESHMYAEGISLRRHCCTRSASHHSQDLQLRHGAPGQRKLSVDGIFSQPPAVYKDLLLLLPSIDTLYNRNQQGV